MKQNPILAVIVPAYNEEEVLSITIQRLTGLLSTMIKGKKISQKSYICFVNDGSRDKTWEIIEKTQKKNKLVNGIKLARNFGHQNALMAGLLTCKADIYISIDADLQDDEGAMESMVDEYLAGSHVVYGVRQSRNTDTFFKSFTAKAFYKLMDAMGVESIYNHADYRLMSSEVVAELKQFNEVNLFLRATIPLIGYKSSTVYYDRKERFAGESKYPLKKMLAFAWDGITSFSTVPLKIVTGIGIIIFIITIMGGIYSLYQKVNSNVVPGWTSTILPILFIGGLQFLSIGVLGEYIGKIYKEAKRRPRFIIEKVI